MKNGGFIAAGAVIPPNTTVPSGQVSKTIIRLTLNIFNFKAIFNKYLSHYIYANILDMGRKPCKILERH